MQISISVWDYDKFSGDDFVSDLRISLGDIQDNRLKVRVAAWMCLVLPCLALCVFGCGGLSCCP